MREDTRAVRYTTIGYLIRTEDNSWLRKHEAVGNLTTSLINAGSTLKENIKTNAV